MIATFRKYVSIENLHILGIIIILAGMPFSRAMMSIGQMILILNWLLDTNLSQKFRKAFTDKTVLAFLGIITIHLIGLLYTENFDYAWKDLRVKLPLIYLPIIFSTTPPLSTDRWRQVFKFFGVVLFAASLYSVYIYFSVGVAEMQSTRNISTIISHIRFSLMIALGIFVLIYIAVFPGKKDKYFRFWGIPLAIWLVLFLLLLRSLTGIVVLGTGLVFMSLWLATLIRHYVFRLIVYMAVLGFVLIGISFFIHSLAKYNYRIKPVENELPEYTANGNKYTHHLSRQIYENSHFVYSHISTKELRKEWEERSELKFDGRDKVGHQLKHTLIRYLASKGLTKDSVGISKLTPKDISAIENGIANHIYLQNFSLYARLYRVFWEIERMKIGSNPTGLSIVQRIYYFEAGWNIFLQNPIIGIGTGDVQDAFDKYYTESNSVLKEKRRSRTHNQYLTILLTFGSIGFIIFMIGIFYPIIIAARNKTLNMPFIIFIIIALMSMINEDTLETQAGALFFTFFYVFFRWGINERPAPTRNS